MAREMECKIPGCEEPLAGRAFTPFGSFTFCAKHHAEANDFSRPEEEEAAFNRAVFEAVKFDASPDPEFPGEVAK